METILIIIAFLLHLVVRYPLEAVPAIIILWLIWRMATSFKPQRPLPAINSLKSNAAYEPDQYQSYQDGSISSGTRPAHPASQAASYTGTGYNTASRIAGPQNSPLARTQASVAMQEQRDAIVREEQVKATAERAQAVQEEKQRAGRRGNDVWKVIDRRVRQVNREQSSMLNAIVMAQLLDKPRAHKGRMHRQAPPAQPSHVDTPADSAPPI